ncbi:MAG: transcription termination factor Rho [Ilumatobacter sp.]|uniref:transcription termination factor Rho n=1 Tax=Ilumatobacter sp. TaxID=1967498 RepID=UPI003296C5C1
MTDGARGFSKPRSKQAAESAGASTSSAPDAEVELGPDGEPLADWEIELRKQGVSTETTSTDASESSGAPERGSGRDENGRRNRDGQRSDGQRSDGQRNDGQRSDGQRSDGQRNDGQRNDASGRNRNGGQNRDGQDDRTDQGGGGNQEARSQQNGNGQGGGNSQGGNSGQGGGNRNTNNNNDDGGNKRRRRRRKGGGRGQEGPQGDDVDLLDDDGQPQSNEPVEVTGYLDMRNEGYGFLRTNGYLPGKEDAYVPVKLARQFGLRKGDQIAGKMRPMRGNEKNPQLLDVHTVNGGDPEKAKSRPHFENLTALFPDEKLTLEDLSDPSNMTARIIDLISPIGKGQRGILVSPPKAGKTTILKTIAKMIEKNNPEVELIVLLIDERPEEVTDIRRTVKGEVISSTFDRPSDEHAAVAEMTIAKARRMVESGKDVVIMLDGITRLSRAYNLSAPSTGKILSGGIDAGALYPPKKFFGSARNVEEGGSLTILATALVDTNSRMDEAIFEEFKGTGNMELRLDRKIAERRIYPAIDVDASSTRHEELLFDRKELQMVWKLRRVLSGLAAEGSAAPGLELLMDRLKTFKSNSEFLNEIAKQPGM